MATEPTNPELAEVYKAANGEDIGKAQPLTTARIFNAMRAAVARWGQPSEAIAPVAPVAPDFYTACAWNEDRGEGRWIAIPGYSDVTEHGVMNRVLEVARKEGYKGTATGRLMELGWEIRPIYLSAPPPQAARKVFLVATGEEHEGEATYTRYDDAPPPLCDSECLYTAAPTPRAARKQEGA